ncbi:hypothetical protein CBR_g25889 [Chara braunii]|uniref:DUF659 domain-containing protein n=1 Tax=Chara braunii TaxID=69332 RepID=A0A388L6M9_CHABU|nr:hypothetical protein CBR_g25889 [Chara braunii]|eukprot:GBG77959.1 hypothetical protein CBR_g25889 [Chara braunii]
MPRSQSQVYEDGGQDENLKAQKKCCVYKYIRGNQFVAARHFRHGKGCPEVTDEALVDIHYNSEYKMSEKFLERIQRFEELHGAAPAVDPQRDEGGEGEMRDAGEQINVDDDDEEVARAGSSRRERGKGVVNEPGGQQGQYVASAHVSVRARAGADTPEASASAGKRKEREEGDRPTAAAAAQKRMRQNTITESFTSKWQMEFKKKWLRFVYSQLLAFNVFRSEPWLDVVRHFRDLPGPVKVLWPSENEIADIETIVHTADDVGADLAEVRAPFYVTGATIMSDERKSCDARPIVNFLAGGSRGVMLVRTMNREGERDRAPDVLARWIKVFDDFPPKWVNAICTDSASTYVAAANMLQGPQQRSEHRRITWLPCAVHVCNKMLSDIGCSGPWSKDIIVRGRAVVHFIKEHGAALHIFRGESNQMGLIYPCETHFASVFAMLERLLAVRSALERTVDDDSWGSRGRGRAGGPAGPASTTPAADEHDEWSDQEDVRGRSGGDDLFIQVDLEEESGGRHGSPLERPRPTSTVSLPAERETDPGSAPSRGVESGIGHRPLGRSGTTSSTALPTSTEQLHRQPAVANRLQRLVRGPRQRLEDRLEGGPVPVQGDDGDRQRLVGGDGGALARGGGSAEADAAVEGIPMGGGGGFSEFGDMGMPQGESVDLALGESESRGDISVGMQDLLGQISFADPSRDSFNRGFEYGSGCPAGDARERVGTDRGATFGAGAHPAVERRPEETVKEVAGVPLPASSVEGAVHMSPGLEDIPTGKSVGVDDICPSAQAEGIAPTTGGDGAVAGTVGAVAGTVGAGGSGVPSAADPMSTSGRGDPTQVDRRDADGQEMPQTLVVRTAVGPMVPHQEPFLEGFRCPAHGGGPVEERRVGRGACIPPVPTFAPSRTRPEIRHVATPRGSLPFGFMTAEELEDHGRRDLTEIDQRILRGLTFWRFRRSGIGRGRRGLTFGGSVAAPSGGAAGPSSPLSAAPREGGSLTPRSVARRRRDTTQRARALLDTMLFGRTDRPWSETRRVTTASVGRQPGLIGVSTSARRRDVVAAGLGGRGGGGGGSDGDGDDRREGVGGATTSAVDPPRTYGLREASIILEEPDVVTRLRQTRHVPLDRRQEGETSGTDGLPMACEARRRDDLAAAAIRTVRGRRVIMGDDPDELPVTPEPPARGRGGQRQRDREGGRDRSHGGVSHRSQRDLRVHDDR